MPKPRKPATQRPLRTLRIFCEGEKTEPNYLKGYLATLDNASRKSIIEIEKTRKNTAVQLVEEAIEVKNSRDSLPNDEFWVVYDRESVAKYSDDLHRKAKAKADRNGINIALTNVCFEYWILIHLVNTQAPYGNCEELLRNSPLNVEIKKLCGSEYEKSVRSIFDILKASLPQARLRAAQLNASGLATADPTRNAHYQINPYVGVVHLLDAIDAFV